MTSKRAGDLLSSFFDENVLKTAQGYSAFFSSWTSIAGEKIAAHSRIRELERSIVQIEADHPGWVQILQTRQQGILETLQRRFPNLGIEGISFRLSREPWDPLHTEQDATESGVDEEAGAEDALGTAAGLRAATEPVMQVSPVPPAKVPPEPSAEPVTPGLEKTETDADPYNRINDEDFKASLKRLEQSISLRTKRKKK
jgi:hypothetical protein